MNGDGAGYRGHGAGYRTCTAGWHRHTHKDHTHTHTHTRTHTALTPHTQVAVADLIGMVLGIELARQAGTQALYIWGAYIVLSLLDFVFIFKVMRACAVADMWIRLDYTN